MIYDEQKQEKAARELAEATVKFYLDGLTADRLENPEQWMRDFLTAWDEWVYKLAPLAKAPKWRAENEYRLVHELRLAEFPLVRFKAKATVIARYIPLDTPSWMSRRASLLPIAKIWIGPGSHQQVSKVSIGLLLNGLRRNVNRNKCDSLTTRLNTEAALKRLGGPDSNSRHPWQGYAPDDSEREQRIEQRNIGETFRSAGWSPNPGEFGLQMDAARPLPRCGRAQAFS